MNALLSFAGVSFGYGDRTILRDLNAKVPHGGCIALIGPNGVGKTTLFRLATGTLRSHCGDIHLDGQPIESLSRRTIARSIALVPQEVEVPFPFTVEQFVQQGRTPHLRIFSGLSQEDWDAVERALELTDTTHLRSRIFNQLSGGERQSVKVALGLAQNPQLLLLDEPTQHLDIGRQFEMIAIVRRLSSEGIAIVASMHDLALIEGTFSRVWLLTQGDRMEQGEPREMLQPRRLEKAFAFALQNAEVPWEQVFPRKEAIPS
jgi:iron complex transport system ATP-binding protein